MTRKLMMNNQSELDFEWDYDKNSDIPVSIRNLLSEYYTGNNINLNVFSDKQILELDIHEVKCINNEPQIMLLYTNNTGSKIYWDNNILKIPNDPNFNLELKTPCKLTLELNNGIIYIYIYIDGILKTSTNTYNSQWLNYTGIQLQNYNRDLIVTGFRYKNFNRGE